jgi:hypothetical protein
LIANDGERDREHPAGGDAGHDAQAHQHLEIGCQPTEERGGAENQHADRDQPRLAKHVGKRAEDGLDQRIG